MGVLDNEFDNCAMLYLYIHMHTVFKNSMCGKLCDRKLHDVIVMQTLALGEGMQRK